MDSRRTRLLISNLLLLLLTACGTQQTVVESTKAITILTDSAPVSLEPTQFNVALRFRLNNVYEGLVRTDQDLRIVPALAISWGNIDDRTWEFTLRPNVKFHNGQLLTARDIIFSIERAKTLPGSELKGLLGNLDSVTATDDHTLHIITKEPDPILLAKLETVYILSESYVKKVGDETLAMAPIGTGPYKAFPSEEKGGDLGLERFADYWGDEPVIARATMKAVTGRGERSKALANATVDILTAVPPQDIPTLRTSETYRVLERPSLGINFLGLNTTSMLLGTDNVLSQQAVRTVLASAIDRAEIVGFAQGLAAGSEQLISSNIFGYNPDIEPLTFDLEKAKSALKQAGFPGGFELTLDLDQSLEKVALTLQGQLSALRIRMKYNLLSPEDLAKKISSGTSQMFLIGWQFETGDASEFLRQFFHSKTTDGSFGDLNGMNYSNAKVDQLIEEQAVTVKTEERLKKLQEIFKLLRDDNIALPLFEAKNVYAVKSDLQWEPRQDGLVRVADITVK